MNLAADLAVDLAADLAVDLAVDLVVDSAIDLARDAVMQWTMDLAGHSKLNWHTLNNSKFQCDRQVSIGLGQGCLCTSFG